MLAVEVDLWPSQPHELADAKARAEEERPERPEPIALLPGKERPGLLRRPVRWRAANLGRRPGEQEGIRPGDAVGSGVLVGGVQWCPGEPNLARSNMPIPDMPRHHFQLEARKFDKVEMRLLQLLGDDDDAGGMAQRILTEGRKPDGTWRQPMLAAKALAALSVQAAHEGDVDEAVARGHQALDIPRQSLPSLISSTADVIDALKPAADQAPVMELRKRIERLVS